MSTFTREEQTEFFVRLEDATFAVNDLLRLIWSSPEATTAWRKLKLFISDDVASFVTGLVNDGVQQVVPRPPYDGEPF